MRTITLICPICLIIFLYIGCSKDFNYDNYGAPDSGVSGTLSDAETGDTLETRRGLNGGSVRYLQIDPKYPNPSVTDIPLKDKGKFSATMMFAGNYKLFPRDGAFKYLKADSTAVTLTSGTIAEVNFKVVPYYRIVASVTDSTFTYKIDKSAANTSDVLQEVIFMVNNLPYVDETIASERNLFGLVRNWIVVPRATATTTPPILPADPVTGFTGVQRTFKIPSWAATGLPKGNAYYFRVGVRTVAVGRYNYSKIIKATVQ